MGAGKSGTKRWKNVFLTGEGNLPLRNSFVFFAVCETRGLRNKMLFSKKEKEKDGNKTPRCAGRCCPSSLPKNRSITMQREM
jgi:hypothetical protein